MMVRMATLSDAEFMSIVLTVTWLSVQTPTTCIIGVTIPIIVSVRQNQSDLGADGLEVSELVVEGLPLLRLQLRQPVIKRTRPIHNQRTYLLTQPVVHEDEDGELAGKLLRGDVDELEALPRLVDADHGEGAESLHHGGALA